MRLSPAALIAAVAFVLALTTPASAEEILTITSDPPGAVVEINGRNVGVTPYQEKVKEFWFKGPKYLWSEFLNTPLQMTVSKEGYETQTVNITAGPFRWVNANNTAEKIFYVIKQTSFHVVLAKPDPNRGRTPLTVTSEPPGAEIHVDGRFEGSTPSTLLLIPGAHTITVTRSGYNPWQRAVNVEAGADKSLHALLEGAGSNARPPGATYTGAAAAPPPTASDKPELIVSTGHGNLVVALAFSPDEKLLASGDANGVIKLWDPRSGTILRTLTEPGFLAQDESEVYALAFSPDGKVVASVTATQVTSAEDSLHWVSVIALWDVASGRALGALQNLEGRYNSVAFSGDGTVLAAGREDNFTTVRESESGVTLWEVASGRELRKFPAPGRVNVLMFTPNGTHLLAGNWGVGLKLWDVKEGVSKDMAGSPLLRDRILGTSSVDFNPYIRRFAAVIAPDEKSVAILESAGMSPKEVLKWDGDGTVITVKFSPSGKALACGDSEGGIKVWDAGTWAETASIRRGQGDGAIAMSANSRLLAYTGSGKVIKLWDLNEETTMRVLGGEAGHSDDITALAFSPDGRTLASGSDDETVKLWDVGTGRVKTLKGHTSSIVEVAFRPDGKTLVTIDDTSEGGDETLRFWDAGSGAALKTIQPSSPPVSLAYSPDGALLAVGNTDKTITIYNALTGRVARTLTGLSGEVESVMFVNAQTLQSFSTDDTGDNPEIKLWNVSSGALLSAVTDKTTDPNAVVFMGNTGNMAVSDKFYAYPLPGGGIDLFSKSATQMVDFSPQSAVAKLYLFDDNDWLITTPEGLFEGSPGGWAHARWRFGGDTFDSSGLELYFNEFFYPNLLQKVLAGEVPRPPGGRELGKIDRRQPSVLISEIEGEANAGFEGRRAGGFRTSKRTASVTITVVDNPEAPKRSGQAASSGAQDLRLFRNGSLVRIWRGDLFQLGEKDGCTQLAPADRGEPRRVRCRAAVTVVAGDNQFSAYAFNREKVKSEDSIFPVEGAATLRRERTLYVLTVGVGRYENPQFNLNYTVRDAQAFGAEVRRQQEMVGYYQRVEVLPLLDEGARKDFILSALKTLAEAVQPEDGLIVYFSGHGVAQGDRFYLLPSDIGYKGPRSAVDDDALRTIFAHGISDLELESAFVGIDAGRLLLIIDACNSGKALDAEDERRGPMDTKGLGQLAYEKGMYVLTASQDAESAYESAALKHSYLTYALVEEGLKVKVGEADADGDGQLFLREWFDYARRRVPRMQTGQAGETSPRPGKSLEEAGGPVRGPAQRPRVFYRREPELQPFVVAKSGARPSTPGGKGAAR